MTLGFRAKIFLASLGVAAAALVFVTVIVAYERRQDERSTIEMRLVSQAQLIAELLQNSNIASASDFDDEADRVAELMQTRVTLIGADGRVLGDSDLEGQALADVENHLQRPEVQQARARGVGVVSGYSTTVRIEMLYAAVTAHHPQVRYVRVALPLTTGATNCVRLSVCRMIAGGISIGDGLPLALCSMRQTARSTMRTTDAVLWTTITGTAGGVPLTSSNRVYFIGQGRMFLDHADDVQNNYLVWGGVRVRF